MADIDTSLIMAELKHLREAMEDIRKRLPKKATPKRSHLKGKKKHGEYKNVLLSEEQYKSVKDVYGDNTDRAIKYFDEQLQAKGYKYKDHALMLTKKDSWVRKNIEDILVEEAKEQRSVWQ